MGNLFKIIVITAPFAALLFFYVVLQQQKLDTELEKESLKFERTWEEFNRDLKWTKDKSRVEERITRAEEGLKEIEEQEEKRKKKLEEFEKEFEKAITEKNAGKN